MFVVRIVRCLNELKAVRCLLFVKNCLRCLFEMS